MLPIQYVVLLVSSILSAIRPVIHAKAFHVARIEATNVRALICHSIASLAMLVTIEELTDIFGASLGQEEEVECAL